MKRVYGAVTALTAGSWPGLFTANTAMKPLSVFIHSGKRATDMPLYWKQRDTHKPRHQPEAWKCF